MLRFRRPCGRRGFLRLLFWPIFLGVGFERALRRPVGNRADDTLPRQLELIARDALGAIRLRPFLNDFAIAIEVCGLKLSELGHLSELISESIHLDPRLLELRGGLLAAIARTRHSDTMIGWDGRELRDAYEYFYSFFRDRRAARINFMSTPSRRRRSSRSET